MAADLQDKLQLIEKRYPFIKKPIGDSLHYDILNTFNLYCQDEHSLCVGCFLTPFSITNVPDNVDGSLKEKTEILNNLQQLDKNLIKPNLSREEKDMVILFLSQHRVIFNLYSNSPDLERFLDRERVHYCTQLLESIDVMNLREELEDQFFRYLEPEIYSNYHNLLKLTYKSYKSSLEKLQEEFNTFLETLGIEASIQGRIKTIASVHRKVMKKNILLSQVLDTLGIRIIAKDIPDCYNILRSIQRRWPIVSSKLKDYIVIPKNDGYQSIHVNIRYQDMDVEIQIRTEEMHQRSEYGLHFNYKQADYIDL